MTEPEKATPPSVPRSQGQLSLLTLLVWSLLMGVVVPLNLRPSIESGGGYQTVEYGFPLTYHVTHNIRAKDGTFELMRNSAADQWLIDRLAIDALIALLPLPFVAFWVRQMFGVRYKDGDAPL
jgi:hypothetical protein